MRYPNAAKGIKKIYIAEILNILAAVLTIALVIIVGANNVDTILSGDEAAQALQSANVSAPFAILGIGMALFMLVAFFMNLSGIIDASKDEAGFKRALWVLVAYIVFSIAGIALENANPQLANWLNVPSTLFELAIKIYLLEGFTNLANNLGKKDVSDMAKQCRTYLMCALILAAAAEVFTALSSKGSAMNTTSGIASNLLQIFAYVIYLRVLNKARFMQ